jgi:predicted amidohydrolase YtcJ
MVSRQLLAYGVTGVTDATPTDDAEDLRILAEAQRHDDLLQRVTVTGGLALDPAAEADLSRGPVKLMAADHGLPDVAQLAADIERAHDQDRNVALHCVTRVALVIALAAWEDAGVRPGDRIEHGGVIAPEQAALVAKFGLTVVTQPNFVAERGDQYRRDVETDDQPYLYPCGSLLARGIPVGGSTDAPYGSADPWKAMTAAVTRATASGHVLGTDERINGAQALAMFLSSPDRPGGPIRRVAVGAPADLCVMAAPRRQVVEELDAELVLATVVGGRVPSVKEP